MMSPQSCGIAFPELREVYLRYVDGFRGPDGELPPMMRLKLEHTFSVVANAESIAHGEDFSASERDAALAAALLHDTGRYEQLRRYDTFRDADSVDHAKLSCDIVLEKGDVVLVKASRGMKLEEIVNHITDFEDNKE